MSTASKPLFDLQQVEVRIESERAAVQSITRTLSGSPEIEAARKRITSLEQEKATAATALRDLERQADDLSVAIKRHNTTLFGGNIHDVREMASIETEIEHAKAKQSGLEDREIELLEKLETVESELGEGRARLEQLTADREHNLGGLRSEKSGHESALVELEAKRKEMASSLDPPTLARYERLRARLGHAVAQVTEGACSACRIQLPAMDAQHAHGNTIATCPNCGRILYDE